MSNEVASVHRPDAHVSVSAQRLARYERLMAISQQLASTLDLASLLNMITAAAQELTDTEAASIILYDPASRELRFEASSNIPRHEMERITIPMDRSIAGWIFTHGEPRVIHNTEAEPAHYDQVDAEIQFTTRSVLGVPMRARSKVTGVLEAVNKRSGEAFNGEDITTLTLLASQAALAIENARLFQQSDFIAEMVHELRTPLVALKASTTLLLRPDLPREKLSDIVLTLQGETERLIRMTSEFLDLSRLESGRFTLERTRFDLAQLVAESISIVQHQAHHNDITLHAALDTCWVYADRGKAKQVVLNLLTNAIKYNRPGGHVRVSAVPTPDAPRMVVLHVADTGYGITRDNLKNLFQKFFRVADGAGQAHGTGLGLVICKHIVEAHGGHIWVESEQGVGSTFSVSLPTA